MATKKADTNMKDFFTDLEKEYDLFFEPEKIRTDIIPLDLALNGFLETGSLIELSGESQTGKSTLLLHLSRILCEKGYKVAYIDAEGSVKDPLLEGVGLMPYKISKDNYDNLFFTQRESTYRKAEALINKLLEKGGFRVIILDSLTALTPDVYLDDTKDRNITEDRVGYEAQLNSRLLQKLSALKTKHNCIIIYINQTRIDMSGWMASYKSSGGQAVKYYPDVRLFMRLKEKLFNKELLPTGEQEIPTGANTTIEAHKSRLGFGFIPYPMTVYFGKGISNLQAYINLLPNIMVKVDGRDTPVLEQQTKVTYLLHLPSGEYKTSKGQGGIPELIVEHQDEVKEIIDNYIENYYIKIKSRLTNQEEPEDVIAKEVKEEEPSE